MIKSFIKWKLNWCVILWFCCWLFVVFHITFACYRRCNRCRRRCRHRHQSIMSPHLKRQVIWNRNFGMGMRMRIWMRIRNHGLFNVIFRFWASEVDGNWAQNSIITVKYLSKWKNHCQIENWPCHTSAHQTNWKFHAFYIDFIIKLA